MSDINPLQNHPLQTVLNEFPRRKPSPTLDMDQEEVVRILELADIASIPMVIAGGWAVDALLGWQTRPHNDLDIAINRSYLMRFLGILSRIGYGLVAEANKDDARYLLDNGAGHQIEIHAYSRDDKGRIMSGSRFPSNSLTGQGKIGHLKVSCLAPEWLVDSYTDKEINQKTLQDLKYICNLFRLPLPIEFQEYDDSLYTKTGDANRIMPEDFTVYSPKTGDEYADLVFMLGEIDSNIAADVRHNEAARFEKVFMDTDPNPQVAADFDLKTGLLLKHEREIVGAIEIGPSRSVMSEDQTGGQIWHIKQLKLGPFSEYARIFRLLVEEALTWSKANGASHVRVAPLDDVATSRNPMLKSFDEAYIGYSTKYEQLGFTPVRGETLQRLILQKTFDSETQEDI